MPGVHAAQSERESRMKGAVTIRELAHELVENPPGEKGFIAILQKLDGISRKAICEAYTKYCDEVYRELLFEKKVLAVGQR